MTDYYAPRKEPDVVLGCGCVVMGWPQITVIGGGTKRYGICETHTDGPGKWGLQRILRDADVYERLVFREYGTPAPKRRSNKARSAMQHVPTQHAKETRAKHPATRSARQDYLF